MIDLLIYILSICRFAESSKEWAEEESPLSSMSKSWLVDSSATNLSCYSYGMAEVSSSDAEWEEDDDAEDAEVSVEGSSSSEPISGFVVAVVIEPLVDTHSG